MHSECTLMELGILLVRHDSGRMTMCLISLEQLAELRYLSPDVCEEDIVKVEWVGSNFVTSHTLC